MTRWNFTFAVAPSEAHAAVPSEGSPSGSSAGHEEESHTTVSSHVDGEDHSTMQGGIFFVALDIEQSYVSLVGPVVSRLQKAVKQPNGV